MLRHWEKAYSVATPGEGEQCGRIKARSVATLGECAQCCDTGRRRAVLRHWEKACSVATLDVQCATLGEQGVQCWDTGRRRCSVATLGEGAQCCDTGRRRAVL